MPRRSRSDARKPRDLFEALESRTLLSYTHPMMAALPGLDAMENPGNTVVRFQTSLGNIDIEMYDAVAPHTVANFLQYIRDGAYDDMFFHRDVPDFVLQGGGYKFEDGQGKRNIPQRDAIANEFNRHNTEGTIAMARLQGQPDSATNQFYFNLKDNPTLDLIDGGFTVFGKVIAGWDNVLAIRDLSTRDYDVKLNGVEGHFFDDVPVIGNPGPSTPVTEAGLVMTWDAEIIKPRGAPDFYTQAAYYAEGFRNANIVERVDVVNSDTGRNNYYQVIVRYETGERDKVIATGLLTPLQRRTIKIVDNAGGFNLVRSGVGYAIEVRSTRVLAASLNHRDFGVTLGESFISTVNQPVNGLKFWNFAAGVKGPGERDFILWDNITDQTVTVYLTLYPQSQPAKEFSFQVERYRRGGVSINTLAGVPNNRVFSVRLASTGPIVAAMSRYEINGLTSTTNGSTELGIPLGGRSEGYLAAARVGPGITSTLSVLYTTGAPSALIDFYFFFDDGSVIRGKPVDLTGLVRRKDINLATMGLTTIPADEPFAIRYKVRGASTAVAVVYTQESDGDTMSTPFTTASGNNLYFGDGYMDPDEVGSTYSETISIFNPYQDTQVSFRWGIQFLFSDGTRLAFNGGTLASLRRLDIRPNEMPGFMAKVNSSPAFRFYSVVLGFTELVNGQPFSGGAGIAQITRIHAQANWRQTMTSGPMVHPGVPLTYMDAPQFDPL
ncbi:MAG: peptidylprolyl isomerase [Phycisphaerales bacterium]|nr:peptidylprolyl isomerase [Phycisphaerales bacterium]